MRIKRVGSFQIELTYEQMIALREAVIKMGDHQLTPDQADVFDEFMILTDGEIKG